MRKGCCGRSGRIGLEGPARTLQLGSDSIPFALWKEHSGCFSMDESGSGEVRRKAIIAA